MVSRRDFLRSSVILPASAAIAAQRRGTTPLRVAVVGAGAFGGWTALHLRRAGAEVTLVDAWGPGNARASSGGETRVLRTIYGPTRKYVEMAARALTLWGEWDRNGSEQFLQADGRALDDRGRGRQLHASVATFPARSQTPVRRNGCSQCREALATNQLRRGHEGVFRT